jgi:hypothetical protein
MNLIYEIAIGIFIGSIIGVLLLPWILKLIGKYMDWVDSL